jgi:hypothetical protein
MGTDRSNKEEKKGEEKDGREKG